MQSKAWARSFRIWPIDGKTVARSSRSEMSQVNHPTVSASSSTTVWCRPAWRQFLGLRITSTALAVSPGVCSESVSAGREMHPLRSPQSSDGLSRPKYPTRSPMANLTHRCDCGLLLPNPLHIAHLHTPSKTARGIGVLILKGNSFFQDITRSHGSARKPRNPRYLCCAARSASMASVTRRLVEYKFWM